MNATYRGHRVERVVFRMTVVDALLVLRRASCACGASRPGWQLARLMSAPSEACLTAPPVA